MTDNIHKPPHYTKSGIEPLDVIEAWNLRHHVACAVKYIARHEHKGAPVQDIQKAIAYMVRYVALLEREGVDRDLRDGVVRSSEDEQRRRERVAAFKNANEETP